MNNILNIKTKEKNKKIDFFLKKVNNSSGFTIVEIIIACTIITTTIFALLSVSEKGIELSGRALRQTQANNLLEEGVEAVKTIRDNNWENISNLSLDTPYYLFFNITTNTWSLSTSSITPSDSIPNYPIDGIFNRTVTLSLVNRDADDDIALIGTVDDQTKQVFVNVNFSSAGKNVSKNLVFYLTDIFN